MTGRKTLSEVRAELEAALGAGPAGATPVAEALRRFLANGTHKNESPKKSRHRTKGIPATPREPGPAAPSGR
jgi:hypothetical protein